MREKLLIVEDEFIVANNLRLVLEQAGYEVCGIASSVKEAKELISKQSIDLVLLDIYLKGKLTGIDLARDLRSENIPFVYLSANSNQQILEAAKTTEPDGFLVKPYREKDVLVTLDIARYRHQHNRESKLVRESSLYKAINDMGNVAGSTEEKLLQMATALQPFLPFDYLSAAVYSKDSSSGDRRGVLRIGFSEYQSIGPEELSVISGLKEPKIMELKPVITLEETAAIFNGVEFEDKCSISAYDRLLADTFQLSSCLVFPLSTKSGRLFVFSFLSKKNNRYSSEHLALLIYLQDSLMLMADILQMQGGNKDSQTRANATRSVARAQPAAIKGLEHIVGVSSSLLHVMDLVTQVAPLETSVMILGESGTGKERIADSIHQLSTRRNKPLVKVNCAALSHSLIESELFGHEKGAFTGATDRKAGKFELASGGTIFLDEIGELPLDQQVKLLRVLQEREVEHLGGIHPIKIDVRVIAATNRNLEKEVAEGRFRLDLYYRLNVFPIMLPALRDRKDDISVLAAHFANRFAGRMNKSFHGISPQMLGELESYHWPGNIRELENIIEQAIILNDGTAAISLKRPLVRPSTQGDMPVGIHSVNSLEEIKILQKQREKEYIVSILRTAKGRIRGAGGAAELLSQKPTTLEYRIVKLGIRKEDYSN